MNSITDKLPRNDSYSHLIKYFADVFIVFLPSIGYIFQAIKFKQTKSSKGFAKFLCLLILIANILRIFFWIGKRFSLPLLLQAIIVVISQIYLIHVYIEYQEDQPITSGKSMSEYLKNWKETLDPKKIWKWYEEIEYYKFIFFWTLILSIICYIVGNKNTHFYEVLGTISVFCETFIELPQIKENFVLKSTKNLSGMMVLMWLIGDLFKTTYNILYKSPMQMIVGGIIMNFEDVILNTQVIIYDENNFFYKIFPKKLKYVNLDDEKSIEESNKIDFDTDKSSG